MSDHCAFSPERMAGAGGPRRRQVVWQIHHSSAVRDIDTSELARSLPSSKRRFATRLEGMVRGRSEGAREVLRGYVRCAIIGGPDQLPAEGTVWRGRHFEAPGDPTWRRHHVHRS
jgi:hypothetical protein